MNFSSQGKQLCIDDFKSSLAGLNKLNRWVQLGDTLPWDEIEKLYNQRLNNGKRGAGNKSARAACLEAIKRKKKSKSLINKGKSRLLAYLPRAIRSFIGLVAINGSQLFDSLKRNGKKIAGAILKMYHQQGQMFKQGSHTCANRIISVFQPNIRPIGKPLGRPPKQARTKEYLAEIAKAVGGRNEIEATFGTGKRIYRANNTRAKLPEADNCWTGMCYFVKNVMEFLRELLYALIFVINLLANPGNIWRILRPFPKFAYCGFLNE